MGSKYMEPMISPPIRYHFDIDTMSNRRIRHKLTNIDKYLYFILNYDKSMICFNDTKTGIYRSVILSYPENKIVCFSPPKSIPLAMFMHKYPETGLNNNNIVVTEFIEGVMINLFYDARSSTWEIATKSAIGGKYIFYEKGKNDAKKLAKTKPTFYRMFLDALGAHAHQELHDLPLLETLSTSMSYTFIVQHPKNTILLPIHRPAAYLVSVYKICSNENYVEYVPRSIYETWSEFQTLHGLIELPQKYEFTGYHNYGIGVTKPPSRGVVYVNTDTGEQATIEFQDYKNQKIAYTIIPNAQYQYLCLRRIKKVEDYLIQYPRQRREFYKIQYSYYDFIKKIHQCYLNYYIYKSSAPLSQFYYNHIYKIHHTIYLPSLQTTPTKVTFKTVMDYFDQFEPRELLYVLSQK